jgi:hypothetical protein
MRRMNSQRGIVGRLHLRMRAQFTRVRGKKQPAEVIIVQARAVPRRPVARLHFNQHRRFGEDDEHSEEAS